MLKNKSLRREGFWRSEQELNLPIASHQINAAWKDTFDRTIVLNFLKSGKEVAAYKGSSDCRICGTTNGSTELSDGTWLWPSGLYHYVAYHDVVPSQDFINHALSIYFELMSESFASNSGFKCGHS